MKVMGKYLCEGCGTEYADRRLAEDCEKCHKYPVSIVRVRHLSKGQNGAGYPVSITVKMSDGKEVVYKR